MEPKHTQIVEVIKAYWTAIFALRTAINRLTWAIVKDMKPEAGKIIHLADNGYGCIGAKLPYTDSDTYAVYVQEHGVNWRIGPGEMSPEPYAPEAFMHVVKGFSEGKNKNPAPGPLPEAELATALAAYEPYKEVLERIKTLGQEIAQRMMESDEALPPAVERQALSDTDDPHKGWLVFNNGRIHYCDQHFPLDAWEMMSPRIWSNVQNDNPNQSPLIYVPFLQYLLVQ